MTGFFYGVWPFKTYSIGIACNLQKKAQKIINSEFMINYNPQDMKNWRLRLCQQDYDQRQLYKYFSGSLVSCLFLLDCAERSILNWLKGSYLKTFFFFLEFSGLWQVLYILYAPLALTSKWKMWTLTCKESSLMSATLLAWALFNNSRELERSWFWWCRGNS